VEILTPSLNQALSMTGADRKWIDALVNTITDSWDTSNSTTTRLFLFFSEIKPAKY
jgi:hypothetical protein